MEENYLGALSDKHISTQPQCSYIWSDVWHLQSSICYSMQMAITAFRALYQINLQVLRDSLGNRREPSTLDKKRKIDACLMVTAGLILWPN